MTTRATAEQLVDALEAAEATAAAEKLEINYNVAPTQSIAVVRDRDSTRTLDSMRWGLVPFFAKDKSNGARMINARSDSVRQKPAYRSAFGKRRCLIPVSGYYEWQKLEDRKQPWYFEPRDGEVLAFAGLWEVWKDPAAEDDEPLRSCAIITTDANRDVEHVHHRMPLALSRDHWDEWLNGSVDQAGALLNPPPVDMLKMYEVSTRVNNVRNNGPGLIEPF